MLINKLRRDAVVALLNRSWNTEWSARTGVPISFSEDWKDWKDWKSIGFGLELLKLLRLDELLGAS